MALAKLGDLYVQPTLAAAAHTVIDLVAQGWTVQVDRLGPLFSPPAPRSDRAAEKARIRSQEHLRRDEQLRKPSVRRFVLGMEQPHVHGDRLVSIFDLMRDGRELSAALDEDPIGSTAIRPYVQVVDDSTCTLTGFRLQDIWRYFRHTWSNAYASVPGRSMSILIRDAVTPYHAVIGLAAVSSPIVQIAERDTWMGWETDTFVRGLSEEPTEKAARWVASRIQAQQDEIYVYDLLRDGVLQPSDLTAPTDDAIARLNADAERHRQRHHRSASIRQVRSIDRGDWVARAQTDLFRSKRAAALAEALDIRMVLGSHLLPESSVEGLRHALQDARARTQLRRLVRRARGERVGTVIADLTVCGAIAPYNALAAGKLVGALAVSPTVLEAYQRKYNRPSEIASSMAGRPVVRESRLSLIATTSLYGTGSSQYNRLYWPADVLGGPAGQRMGFHELGRSRSYGTSHLTDESVKALLRFSVLKDSSVRVNSLFGEGVSPRLRKVRLGLSALGWPTDDLLKHGRERIVYGVPLVSNLTDYSIGVDSTPDYLLDTEVEDGDQRIADWWLVRWAARRAAQEPVRDAMQAHRLTRPITHGARVRLPESDGAVDQLPLMAQPS
ncbi:DUF4338 domain-containing protein [Micropruina sonneratiae]|uniref:DUF4338 domain-containing protein n=1 Tax=Micropruina sonneratiae TaxID=2986940 RepID=UPI0022266613|nr:DUF4338 domain-containing protein [Micropruina sp. KQZ13P-5]MCW3159466.1 DUF4338 domain-containing protein [Micropruina sp. KQZ13P-5]